METMTQQNRYCC